MCPLLVVAFELVLNRGSLTIMPWADSPADIGDICNIFLWRITGCHARAGLPASMRSRSGSSTWIPYRYTRNPMYLGHLIFMVGLVLTFWSWFALILLVARATWFSDVSCRTRRGSKKYSVVNMLPIASG